MVGVSLTRNLSALAILAEVAKGEDFVVSNANLGGDPLVNSVKSCAVYYSAGGFLKGRFALEGESLNFSKDIVSIFYGPAGATVPVAITEQVAYYNFYNALLTGKSIAVNNKTMDKDPAPGVRKECTIVYKAPALKQLTWCKRTESCILHLRAGFLGS